MHMTKNSPDEVCAAFAGKANDLYVKQLDDETVMIQGSKESLEFLGRLLVAQSSFDGDCGVQIGPGGPGSTFLAPGSLGIYVHRVPCSHKTQKSLVEKGPRSPA
jgi:hypothetical protein